MRFGKYMTVATVSRIAAVMVMCLGWVCLEAQAAVYYVSPTGSAGGDGSPGNPWSLSKANTDLMPGDTAILMNGSYSTPIAPSRNGSAGLEITYQAANSRQAVLTTSNPRINIPGRSYITVDGVKAENAGRWILGSGASHITINDCYFRNSSSWESCRFQNSGGYITITNCHIQSGNDSLHIRESDHHYIAGNTFITDSHTNLIMMGVHNSVVENNSLSNAGQKCMEVFSMRQVLPPNERKSEYNLIQGNYFYSVSSGIQYAGSNTILRRNIFDGCGTGMNWANYGGTDPGDDPEAWWDEHNRFYNNVLYGCGNAIAAGSMSRTWPLGGAYGDFVHVNNIIYAPGGSDQVSISGDADPSHLEFYYNSILRSSPGQDVFYWANRPGPDDYYTVAQIETAYPALYAGNMEHNPQFVNAAGDDFHLQGGSPCIDAGGPLTSTVGPGSGTVVTVDDALYFTDGYGIVAPDVIRVGSEQVTIVSVNYATNQVTVDRSISWPPSAPVYTDYKGAAPDLGAFEYPSADPAAIAGRYVFYNNCAFDGNDPSANAADDAAIATDKTPLVIGQTAAFANYTSYSRGINGVMVDISDLPGMPIAADFAFKVGNDANPAGWLTAPAPTSVTVRLGAGAGGSDRVTIIWADNAIANQWLQLTVLGTANTGLGGDDVFYFGNTIGETGNSPSDAEVTPTDEIAVRNDPHTLVQSPAGITNTQDFNRDRKVGPTDQIICRNNGTSGPTALQLINLVVNQPPTVDAGPDEAITLPTNTVALDGTVGDDGYPIPPGALTTGWTKVSGPGTVTFGDAPSVDTSATFSAAGVYVLQLEAYDGELSTSDTVQITLTDPTGIFFADDFDDNNLDGWTTLDGIMETLQYLLQPGYEVHAMALDSRMRADLTDTNLSDTVYTSFKIRHTGINSGRGWKGGWMWFVNDAGAGFGLYVALEQEGNGLLQLETTVDDGDSTTAYPGAYSSPGPASGDDLKQIELVYNRVTDQVECFYEGVSKGTVSVDPSYRNFTRVVVRLYNYYDGWWGQLDIDDIRIANTPVGG